MTVFAGVRAVLFDLDGTLLDSAPDLAGAANAMRTQRGLAALPLEQFRAHTGSGARGMLRVAFGVEPGHDNFDELKQQFFSEYQERLTELTRPFEGVDRLIDVLSGAGLLWGVVTNKGERFTGPLMRAMPLFATAATVISGDTTAHAKPHPAPLMEAARRMGLPPSECLYVGDDLRDIQAGRAAGMRTVAARYGYLGAGADVSRWEADQVISEPTELLKWLELP
jgi:N-acetyl-D-muramate 6-phosphate phosphatase